LTGCAGFISNEKRGRGSLKIPGGDGAKTPVLSPRSFNQLWKEKRDKNNLQAI
jgi:hypothetical protein